MNCKLDAMNRFEMLDLSIQTKKHYLIWFFNKLFGPENFLKLIQKQYLMRKLQMQCI